ncbi:hypothetical protein LTR17_025693 [Elasticomyces elasticus]|nr:hypothetical protein LTR17_025693 [Elasticomyces elasticus]
MAAAQQVLGLPELVEIVLLGLPTRDLLLTERVCKTFKGVMDRSKNIQKALFFLPGTADDVNFNPQDIHHYDRLGKAPLKTVVSNSLLLKLKSTTFVLRSKVLGRGAQGSCARMLLAQPPEPAVIWHYSSGGRDRRFVQANEDVERGETLGSVLQRIPELATDTCGGVFRLLDVDSQPTLCRLAA